MPNEELEQAIDLVQKGYPIPTAARIAAVNVNDLRQVLAERDRRKGNHQTRKIN
jgi:predicted HTH domain antitoxin